MKTRIKLTILSLLFISGLMNYSCSKDNSIELNTNYLTVTDVLEYCSRDCGEETDLKGEAIKVKGFLKTDDLGNFLYNLSPGKLVFILFDIRNSKGITIEILEDSLQIEQKLINLSKEMLLIEGNINYGYIPGSNSGCSNSLYIEIDKAGDIIND